MKVLHSTTFTFLTASEYRSWLLCYSLPVLNGILADPYFTHYSLLVAAMHILLSECITPSELRRAELYIHRFYEMFATLYGMDHAYILCSNFSISEITPLLGVQLTHDVSVNFCVQVITAAL